MAVLLQGSPLLMLWVHFIIHCLLGCGASPTELLSTAAHHHLHHIQGIQGRHARCWWLCIHQQENPQCINPLIGQAN